MAEDAFARLRRLRGVALPVNVHVQAQQPEGEAPLSPLALFQQIHTLGVKLIPSPDGTVRCCAPQDVLTPALRDGMRQHQDVLHALVESFEERAAIAEYCAGLLPDEAERLAWYGLRMLKAGEGR